MKNISINLSGSKSITNRLLVLNSLYNNPIILKNLSLSQDSKLMSEALASNHEIIDIHHAGTAMRFLTAYYSIFSGRKTILTGSSRMKERPIEILVNALIDLGADISYLEKKGYPPLLIYGREIYKNTVKLSASISSQYLTALCLIGAKLKRGLNIEIISKVTSFPYLNMTLQILKDLGIPANFENNIINIPYYDQLENQEYIIESDWSSASYHYSLCALGNELTINMKYLFENSLQADRRIESIFKEFFGVNTIFNNGEIKIYKNTDFKYPNNIEIDMNDCPDIAQTVAVTAFGLKIPIKITGLETLKIKETNRLQALKNELEKCGGEVEISNSSIELKNNFNFNKNQSIKTYNDHRMAMSFTPLKLVFPLNIENPEVVVKSYIEFWNDMSLYGLSY